MNVFCSLKFLSNLKGSKKDENRPKMTVQQFQGDLCRENIQILILVYVGLKLLLIHITRMKSTENQTFPLGYKLANNEAECDLI